MLARQPRVLSKAARLFSTKQSFDFVIVGAGAAGLNVASQLAIYQKQGILAPEVNVAIIDPSSQHHAQEAWQFATLGETGDSPNSYIDTLYGGVSPITQPVIDAEAPTIFKELAGRQLFQTQDIARHPESEEHHEAFIDSLPESFAAPRKPVQAMDLADWTKSTVKAGRKPATLIEDSVQTFSPEKNTVTTKGGSEISYKQLIVATGESFDLDAIPGLRAGMETKDSGIMTFADPDKCLTACQYLWALRDGIFLLNRPHRAFQPAEILPQELLAFFHDVDKTRVLELYYYNDDDRKDGLFGSTIEDTPRHELVEIRPDTKEAVFNVTSGPWIGKQNVQHFDYFLVTPPKVPSAEVKASPLADADGYVDVDMSTFQSTKFPNVFSMGSTSNVPAPKDLFSIRLQSPVLVDNAVCAFQGKELPASFDGDQYVGCDRPKFDFYEGLIMGEVRALDEGTMDIEQETSDNNFISRLADRYQKTWTAIESPFPPPTLGH